MSEAPTTRLRDLVRGESKGTGPEELFHQCQRCGRHLSNPISMRQGFGPVCITKVRRLEAQQEQEQDDAI